MKTRDSRWLPMLPIIMGCTSTLSGSGSTQDAALPFVDATRPEILDGSVAATDVPPWFDSAQSDVPTVLDTSQDIVDLDSRTDGDMRDLPADDGLRAPPPDAARPLGRRVIELATAVHADCALMEDGDVWCWGERGPPLQQRRQETPDAAVLHPPTPMAIPIGARSIIGTRGGFCVLTNTQEVWCWGWAYSFYLVAAEQSPGFLRPVRIEGARGTELTFGPIYEGFACVWQRAEARCWGAYLPAGSFPGADIPEFTWGGLVARPPLGALGIERPSSVSGLGFVGERTIHRWGDWGPTSRVSQGTWELPSRPVQIAMNTPRGAGCYLDVGGGVGCWGMDPSSSPPQVRRVRGIPRALGLTGLAGTHNINGLGQIFVLGDDGSVWRLSSSATLPDPNAYVFVEQRLSAQPLPGRVRTFLRSEGRSVYWMILTEDGVVYHRHMGEGDTWTRFFP